MTSKPHFAQRSPANVPKVRGNGVNSRLPAKVGKGGKGDKPDEFSE